MLEFTVASDLVDYGPQEDGVPFIGEAYYVEATDEKGNRWAHHHRFHSVVVHVDDEGYNRFKDNREVAVLAVNRLLGRILNQGSIDIVHWDQARPVYGSDAYVDYGQYNDWMEERIAG
jgi:hypothetical protein